MPTFILNKLVRDNLITEYEKLNQNAVHRTLTSADLANALKQKLIEEVNEVDITSREVVMNELVDVHQVIEDILILHNIAPEEIEKIKQAKFEKKGGFSTGAFVETLTLSNNDPWVEYYRKDPKLYPEISEKE